MTNKLLNFKQFLEKGASIKPCGPGEHRHKGRTDCHPYEQKHHKHAKMGLDVHHGMDSLTGQIPEGTIPPNWEDHHDLATPHASKGGKCEPSEYPKGSGEIVPSHRHSGADYCHPITQKHGLTTEVAQAWHDNNAALIQESWYEFNESEGLPQPEATPDEPEPSSWELEDETTSAAQDADADSPTTFADTIESQGTPTNPYNVQVGDTIGVKDSNDVTTYHKITDIWANPEDGTEHAQSNSGPLIDLSDPEVTGVTESVTESYGPAIDPNNPHDLQIGSVFTASTGSKSTVLDISNGNVTYKFDLVGTGFADTYTSDISTFNKYISDDIAKDENNVTSLEHPGIPDSPPGEYTGEIAISDLSPDNIELAPKVGDTVDSQTLQDVVVGTTLHKVGIEGGKSITILSNQTANQVLTIQPEGLASYPISYDNFTNNGLQEFVVSGLDSELSDKVNNGFKLGGKATNENLLSLPAGLMFSFTVGSDYDSSLTEPVPVTATITSTSNLSVVMDLQYPDQKYSNVKVMSLSDIVDSSQQKSGLKIVGLPSGEVVQHVPEPLEPVVINKHGLDKGTTVKVKLYGDVVASAEIIKTHKLKAGGQNYVLKYTDGPYEGDEKKVSSQSSKFSTEAYSDESTGADIYVDEAKYKSGQEPDQVSELTLPPLGSEPGNWDDVLEQVGGQQGYNEGGTFKHKQTGDEFYVKFSSSGNADQVKSEALANKLYMLLGVDTLGTSLIDFQGKTAIISPMDKNLTTININDMSNEPEIMDNFVVDAWLANWDVIGPKNDNIQKSGNKIVKVDSGGALKFGGAGGAKAFGSEVVELESMRDPTTAKVAHQVFSKVSEQNLTTGAQKIAKVTDKQIDAIVNASKIDNKAEMATILKARRDDIVQKILNTDTATAAKTGGKPGQHEHDGVTGWHDKNTKHSPKNTVANAAHKELGLFHHDPKAGITGDATTKFWATIASNPEVSSEVKALATEALNHDFGTDQKSAYTTQAIISKFLKDNNIEDTQKKTLGDWQASGAKNSQGMEDKYMYSRIKINASLAKLRGEDMASLRKTEGQHWQGRGAAQFHEAWDEGSNDAMALIPYIAASQQQVKSLTNSTGTINRIYRGLQGDIAPILKAARKAALKAGPGVVKEIWLGGGLQGWSMNKSTSKSIGAGSDGVLMSKENITPDDVLLYFNAFSNSHIGEQELALDPNSHAWFSPNEVDHAGTDGWGGN